VFCVNLLLVNIKLVYACISSLFHSFGFLFWFSAVVCVVSTSASDCLERPISDPRNVSCRTLDLTHSHNQVGLLCGEVF